MPGTFYHFRIVTFNNGVALPGADGTFLTLTPIPATDSASIVGTHSVILCGRVNPQGGTTACYFEYGTTTYYGGRMPGHDVGNGADLVTVVDTVKNLLSGTWYHFRIVALNKGVTMPGTDGSFFIPNPMVFPQTVGTTWTYAHTYSSGSHLGTGEYTTKSGTWTWNVVSTSVEGGVTSSNVQVTELDTVWLSHLVGTELAPIFRTPRKDTILCQEVSKCQNRSDGVDLTRNLSWMLYG